jgi:hypothetical protein
MVYCYVALMSVGIFQFYFAISCTSPLLVLLVFVLTYVGRSISLLVHKLLESKFLKCEK